jgi:hypothetical protein
VYHELRMQRGTRLFAVYFAPIFVVNKKNDAVRRDFGHSHPALSAGVAI